MATENVAILFTDMVGSTALASGLSPDAAEEIRRGHCSILRQAAAEPGGTLSDLSHELSEVAGDDQSRVIDQRLTA